MESVPRRELMVAFRKWIGGAGQVGGLGSSSYGDNLVWVGLEGRRIALVVAMVVACLRYEENRGVFV